MPLITNNIELAIEDLIQGKPVAIPTETVYGLAALINKPLAIEAVFSMKKRPLNHPLIVHVAEGCDLYEWVETIPAYAQRLMDAFWPGPLTLVFNSKKQAINPLVTGGQSTVAMRCPAHPLTQELLKRLKTPLVAPSANPFGKISPTTALHVQKSFNTEALTILEGGRCTVGIESTIIDASKEEGYQILRHGLIDEESIAHVIASKQLETKNTIRVPGKLESHYQPQKPLYYFSDAEKLAAFCQERAGKVYTIADKQPPSVSSHHFHPLAKTPKTAAFDLYYQLREADESEALCIVIQLPKETGAWEGIKERIIKAGSCIEKELDPKAT